MVKRNALRCRFMGTAVKVRTTFEPKIYTRLAKLEKLRSVSFVPGVAVQILEFTKRMVVDPPFCYWTINERYRDEDLPSFDICPAIDEDQDLRLRLRPNTREDSSIFVAG
ncbi:hypothetical protein P5673_018724 [Acropora cervicornis]|uniref:Uncharacterized protein n=1 Tax=Acropora cervicornis TaxID=6130 RepID=A0AAD9QD22_ACRCE|nr:hypothetical protein P5673_018724 [Acropora cervicornis]